MTNQELIDTLHKASASQDNIALKMLLIMSAERIEELKMLLIMSAERIEELHYELKEVK